MPRTICRFQNLTFISKVIERIVAEQIKKHLVDSNSMQPLQSAYRSGHSTERALIKVISDIIDAADGQQVTLLDMNAAFDTVDHDILLHRLETSYGIRGWGHFGGSPPSYITIKSFLIATMLWLPSFSLLTEASSVISFTCQVCHFLNGRLKLVTGEASLRQDSLKHCLPYRALGVERSCALAPHWGKKARALGESRLDSTIYWKLLYLWKFRLYRNNFLSDVMVFINMNYFNYDVKKLEQKCVKARDMK